MGPVRQCLMRYKSMLEQQREASKLLKDQRSLDLIKIELDFCIQAIINHDQETLERLQEAGIA